MKKGYCTKYALTAGIFEVSVEISSDNPKYCFIRSGGWQMLRVNNEFWEDKEAAEADARRRARRRIASLKKQIAHMECLAEKVKWRK